MERLVESIWLDFGFSAKTSGLITWLVYPIKESLSLIHSIHRNYQFTDPTSEAILQNLHLIAICNKVKKGYWEKYSTSTVIPLTSVFDVME